MNTLNPIVIAEITALRKALAALTAKWRREQGEYPVATNFGASYAAAAVRLCADELDAALGGQPPPTGGQP